MSEYKDKLVLWLNSGKDGKPPYYSLKNVSDEPITIEPGKSLNLFTRKLPVASVAEKVDQEQDLSDEIPF